MGSNKVRRLLAGVGIVVAFTAGAAAAAVTQDGSGNQPVPDGRASRVGPSSPVESRFVPIVPCRVVNTATSGAGRFNPGQTRAYRTQGNTSSQGGAAACGIPSTASALEVNITAPSATGNGYIRVAPAGVAIPGATFMNFTNVFNASNAGAVRVTKGVGNNLQVRVFNSATHVVIDVLGYYVDDLLAVVEGTGTLVRATAGTTVTRSSVGNYQVRFDRNVRGCAYVANIGLTGDVGTASDGAATVVGENASVNGVWVSTFNTAGAATDRPFHLTVHC